MNITNLTDLIGNTPMVRLTKLFPEDARVYAKLEGFNLTGSMKARSALGMIEAAEERGELHPGDTIIESTSGNLGYALAAVGRHKGYEVILVIDPKTDPLKKNILKAYGARIEVVDEPDEFGAYQPSRIKRVRELLQKIPHSWTPFQYGNEDNLKTHYKTTGPEIFDAMDGNIDVLIGSLGTCGHLGGIAKYLKEQLPNLRVIGVEPVGSVISGGTYCSYLTQGPGLSFVPSNFNPDIIREVYKVSDKDAFFAARELASMEGLLYGASSGEVIHVAKKVAKEAPGKNIVTVLADDGFRYADHFYADNYLATHGIMPLGD